ncbi:MAG: non-heme iron oxygenase ferredoxin subunit [Thaumarchaeota archaeon]|nr:non-heme iron oxygenase ferredoxin subunit [Nitrososphaerota archaeon]
MRWIKTVNITDIKNEEIFSLDLEGREMMLIKKNTEVFALDRICTHERADLSMGFLSEDSVTCPLHLSQFEFETGKALNPPAEGSLKSYKVKIEENVIYVLVD